MASAASRRDARLSRPRTVAYIFIILFAAGFIYLLIGRDMRFFRVPTKSMVPTILPGEFLVALNAPEYRRGDIIILDDPLAEGEYLCKRIVAVGGDTLSTVGGALQINGSYVSEPYVAEPPVYQVRPYTVPPDSVFVLGDNRNWSVDSHNWNEDPEGLPLVEGIPLDSIVGRVRYVYLPLKAARKITNNTLASVGQLESRAAESPAGKRVQ